MYTQILEDIGFTKGEIKVYFALLELGDTTSGPIINSSGVSRSKVYEILDKLEKKGLVTQVIKNKISYFQASPPNRVMDYIKTKEHKLKKQEEEFKKILPQLEQKQEFQETKQEAKVYVGFEGLKTFYNEIYSELDKKHEYYAFTFARDQIGPQLIRFFHNFHMKRAEKGAKAKILAHKDNIGFKNMDFSDTKYYEFRRTQYRLPTGIAIYKDTVATVNIGKIPRVFAIVCKDNAERYREFFDYVWKKSS